MSSYKTSDGNYLTKKYIDHKVEETKNIYTQTVAESLHIDPNDIFCERCKISNRISTGVSRSHIMSVDFCQRSGRSELAFEIMNLEHLCLSCHRELESNDNEFRESWYNHRMEHVLNFNELPNYSDFKNK